VIGLLVQRVYKRREEEEEEEEEEEAEERSPLMRAKASR
jgi:hypothetical protein